MIRGAYVGPKTIAAPAYQDKRKKAATRHVSQNGYICR